MKFFSLALICVFIALSGCHKKKHKINGKPTYSFNLKYCKKNYLLNFDQQFEDQRIIPLQLKDSGRLASISKILVSNSKLFILDDSFSQLYSFDLNGRQLMKYGHIGLDQAGYKKISDFDIEGNQIAILSNDDQVIIYYNILTGAFIKRQSINLFGSSIAMLSNGNSLIYINQNNNKVSDGHNVITLDSIGDVEDRFFDFDTKKSLMAIKFSGFMKKSNGDIYYAPCFSDIVYKYDDGEFKPFVNVGINSSFINANINNFSKICQETIIRLPETSFLGPDFLKSSNYIVTTFQDSLHSQFCFYNINNPQINVLRKDIVQDPNLFLMHKPLYINKTDQIIFDILPSTVYYLKTSLPEEYATLSSENKNILNKIDRKSNPLLMLCELKHK